MSDYELATEHETVNFWRSGGIAKIELNRPDAMNAWGAPMSRDLLACVATCQYDDSIRAVLVTGAGRGFCSGADLRDVTGDTTPGGQIDLMTKLHTSYHPVIRGIRTMPKPVVAAVNGGAVGVGMSLALAADLIVAKESAYFLQAFVNIGLVPDGGSSVLIPTKIGFARAMELSMLGERLPAPTALEWGLINRVVDDASFEAEADALVARLADGPTRSYAGTKRQLNAWALRGMEDQLDLEARIQQEMAATGDFAEGVTAFLEKRPASFDGA